MPLRTFGCLIIILLFIHTCVGLLQVAIYSECSLHMPVCIGDMGVSDDITCHLIFRFQYKHTLKTLSTLNNSVSTPAPAPPPPSSGHHQTQSERIPTEICTEVCWRGAEESRVHNWLDRLKPPVLWRPQFHGDLSLKLAGAAGGALREGAEYVVVVSQLKVDTKCITLLMKS